MGCAVSGAAFPANTLCAVDAFITLRQFVSRTVPCEALGSRKCRGTYIVAAFPAAFRYSSLKEPKTTVSYLSCYLRWCFSAGSRNPLVRKASTAWWMGNKHCLHIRVALRPETSQIHPGLRRRNSSGFAPSFCSGAQLTKTISYLHFHRGSLQSQVAKGIHSFVVHDNNLIRIASRTLAGELVA